MNNFSVISRPEHFIVWYDDDICFALDQHIELTFYKCYLTETTRTGTGLHIVPLHITHQANQSLFLLLNNVQLAEKQQIFGVFIPLKPLDQNKPELVQINIQCQLSKVMCIVNKSYLPIFLKFHYFCLSCYCVILRFNKGGQINISVM